MIDNKVKKIRYGGNKWSGHHRTQTWKLQKYIIRQFNEKLDNLFIKKCLQFLVYYGIMFHIKVRMIGLSKAIPLRYQTWMVQFFSCLIICEIVFFVYTILIIYTIKNPLLN